MCDKLLLFVEHTYIMLMTHLQHKRLAGRATLKEYMIPIAMMAFWININSSSLSFIFLDPIYDLRNLPALSSNGQWV
jgi:hypothetical protein